MCADRQILSTLAEALADHVVDGEAYLGFKIDPPSPRRRLFVLLGGDGSVLARSRTAADVVAVLTGHLGGLDAPAPDFGVLPLRVRGVVGRRRAVLVDPALLVAEPLAERRLTRLGLALLDLSHVRIDVESLSLTPIPIPWAGLRSLDPGDGHCRPDRLAHRAVALLWSRASPAAAPTPAQTVHTLAAAARAADRAATLDAAVDLSDRLSIASAGTTRGEVTRLVHQVLDG